MKQLASREDMTAVKVVNNLAKTEINYLSIIWVTKTLQAYTIREMERSHIRNSLQWCIQKGADTSDEKDGIAYADWIRYFTIRLLDPTLP